MVQTAFNFSVPPAVHQRLIDPSRLDGVTRVWSRRFALYLSRPFRARFTDNTSTMISTRNRAGIMHLRLHHMFIEADDRVLKALATYLEGSKRGNRCLDGFIARNADKVGRRRLGQSTGSRGTRYDLTRIRDALNRAYFEVPVEVPIVWARARSLKRRRSIRLGSYSFADRVIRIHPALDNDFVPPHVVVGVVFHEMLHHDLGSLDKSGRRMVHTRIFKERERVFVHWSRAQEWERKNLGRLLKVKP